MLIEEGKPLQPSEDASAQTRMAWLNARPRAHHLIYWNESSERSVTFENATGTLTLHVQPVKDGWLLAEARGGRADIYNYKGRQEAVLDLGDASNDVQTTPDGKIWVSYFDEGVYGRGIGNQQGLVCFDSAGHPIFKYFDFAMDNKLPLIDDCYAMNVVSEHEVWLSYYSEFPLVAIKDFQVQRVWEGFGCVGGPFGVFENSIVFPKCYARPKSELVRRTLTEPVQSESLEVNDSQGEPIRGRFKSAARGSKFFLWTESDLYELCQNS